jgi:hypothetical protein
LTQGKVVPQDRPPDCKTDLNVHVSSVLCDDVPNVFTLLYDDVLKLRKNIPVNVSSILYDEMVQREEDDLARRVWEVWRKEERESECRRVMTMYKRKDREVNPVDAPLSGGIKPEGGPWD